MNKLLEFSTNTKLDAPNATLEGKIVKHFGNRHRLNNLVEIEAVEKQTKEVQIVPSRAIGNSTMTRKNTTLNKVIRKQQRYGVISANLLHTNLAILHYTGKIDGFLWISKSANRQFLLFRIGLSLK